MRSIGIDIGSTYTKYCVMDTAERKEKYAEENRGSANEKPEGSRQTELFSERTPVLQKRYFEKKLEMLTAEYGRCPVATCGYGRKNAGTGRNVSELTALAKGASYLYPDSYAVLDIGGQDTKLICHRKGRIEKFFINEKCAAGSGMFLSNTLNLLGISFDDIDLRGASRPEIKLSSVCAVFAQSEIVELISEGAEPGDIVPAVIEQILVQAKTLIGKAYCKEILLSGGLTQIPGISGYAEEILGIAVNAADEGSYLAAIGCAVISG